MEYLRCPRPYPSSPEQRSLDAFRACVMEGPPYLIPAEQALPVLAAVDALYRSAETRKKEAIVLEEGAGP